jgi:hypothetical protein
MIYMPQDAMKALKDWSDLADAYMRMNMAALEVIVRRTQRMATGEMTPPEALAMVLEKSTAFAVSTEKAAVAAARGADVLAIATAALKPYGAKTRSNVRELRK